MRIWSSAWRQPHDISGFPSNHDEKWYSLNKTKKRCYEKTETMFCLNCLQILVFKMRNLWVVVHIGENCEYYTRLQYSKLFERRQPGNLQKHTSFFRLEDNCVTLLLNISLTDYCDKCTTLMANLKKYVKSLFEGKPHLFGGISAFPQKIEF